MSKKINSTYIGAFVLGGLALFLLVLVVLGGGLLRKPAARYVMFFEGSVGGLRIGAPVTFRGVKVGTVADIALTLGRDSQSINIPVTIEFAEGRISAEGLPGAPENGDARDFIDRLVEQGLRGQLQLQSIVTGQLQVTLDFFPGSPIRLTGLNYDDIPELPTVPSPLEALTRKLEALPISDIIDQISRITVGIDRIVNSTGTEEAVRGLADSMIELRALIRQIDEKLPGIIAKMETTVTHADQLVSEAAAGIRELTPAAKAAMEQLRATAALESGRPAELAASLEKLIAATEKAVAESEKTLLALRASAAPDSPLRHQVGVLIEDLSDASRAVRSAADFLDRHPEAILRGKGGE